MPHASDPAAAQWCAAQRQLGRPSVASSQSLHAAKRAERAAPAAHPPRLTAGAESVAVVATTFQPLPYTKQPLNVTAIKLEGVVPRPPVPLKP